MSHDFTDEELRAAYGQARGTGRPTTRGAACPSPEALLAAARADAGVDETERLRTLDHALRCPACRPELALLHAVSGAHGAPVELPNQRPPGRVVGHIGTWRRVVPLAAAASLVLAVGVATIARRGPTGESPAGETLRAGGGELPLVAPGDGAAVATATPVAFAWRAVPGAFRYTLEVTTTDGTVVLSTQTADTLLSAPLRAAAGEYRWSVRAEAGDGSVRRSEARALHMR